MNTPIDTFDPIFAAAHKRYERNRAILAGEDAVKASPLDKTFLAPLKGMKQADYDGYKARVSFFAGAARTREGLRGLMFRKAPTFDCPANVKGLFDTITKRGDSYVDLATSLADDGLGVGAKGCLVDASNDIDEFTTVDKALAAGNRPFVNEYPIETVLGMEFGVWQNRQVLSRVRLLEDKDTVRELLLENGIYSVVMWHRVGGTWEHEEPFTPLRKGQPLNRIPFWLVSHTEKAFGPVPGPLDHVCDLNRHLYIAEAMASNSRHYSSAPFLVVKGAKKADLTITPGAILFFETNDKENPPEVEFVEFSGAGQATLEAAVATKKDEMAKMGSNMLASEKSAVEAAETHAIRRSSENSVLSAIAKNLSRHICEVLDFVSYWAGNEPGQVTFALNTDFVPTPMSAQERTALLAELQANVISWDTYIDQMIAGEILPDDFDREADRARIETISLEQDRAAAELASQMMAQSSEDEPTE